MATVGAQLCWAKMPQAPRRCCRSRFLLPGSPAVSIRRAEPSSHRAPGDEPSRRSAVQFGQSLMTQIDFYVLPDTTLEARLDFACRLAETIAQGLSAAPARRGRGHGPDARRAALDLPPRRLCASRPAG